MGRKRISLLASCCVQCLCTIGGYPLNRPNCLENSLKNNTLASRCLGIFRDNYINKKSINWLPMHAKRAHYGTCRKNCFILYVHISHANSLVSIEKSVLTLKTFPGILFSNARPLKILLTYHPVYRIILWHNCTNVMDIPWWEIIHS